MSGNDGRDGSTTRAYRKLMLITRYSQEGHIVPHPVGSSAAELFGQRRVVAGQAIRGQPEEPAHNFPLA